MSPEQVIRMLEEKIARERGASQHMQPVYRGEPAEISQPVYKSGMPLEAILAGEKDPRGYEYASGNRVPIEDQLMQLWSLFGKQRR
jgi:hypothetical protein